MYVRSIIIAGLLALGAPGVGFAERTRGAGAEAQHGITGVVEAVHSSTRSFRVAGRYFRVPDEVADFERVKQHEMVTVFWKPGDRGPEVVALDFPGDR